MTPSRSVRRALTSLASVANTATEIDAGAAQTVNVGSVLTLSEAFTTGSAANYNTAVACTGTTGLVGSTLTVGAADTAIVCTYTNTKKTATVTLRKSWTNATLNDAVTVSATGLTSLASVANTATEIDAGAAQTVNVGSVLTLAEAFTTGSAANYNTAVACTGTTGLVGSTLTVGAADTAIVCTYTNTKKTATVTLRKAWTNATLNDAVTVSATGLTSLASVANTATEIDAGAAQTVNVGSVLTLSEAFTTGSAADYNSNPSCTGTTGLVGSTLTVGAADTAIVCTFTNTRLPTITAVKTVSVSPLVVGGSGQFYNITITIANSATTAPLLITDALPTGITLFGAPTITGGTSTASHSLAVQPVAAPPTVSNQHRRHCGHHHRARSSERAATATNGNNTANLNGGGDPACTAATGQACDPTVNVPVTTPAVSVAKTASPAAGTTVAVGQTITYTLTSTVTNAATTTVSTLTDTLGTGLTFGAIGANPGGYTCTTVGSVVTCTLPWHRDRHLQRELHSDREHIGHDQRLQQRGTDRWADLYHLYRHQPGGPTITAVKTVSVSPLVVGGSGQFYNITITIANSATTAPLLITDALPTGITLSGAPTVTGGTSTAVTVACPASGSNTTGCQINTGATVGTIIVRVPVNVAAAGWRPTVTTRLT